MLYNYLVDVYYLDSSVIFFLSELANFAFCSIILCLLFYFKKLERRELVLWFLGFSSIIILTPFVQFLFPDAQGYLHCVRDLKDNLSFDHISCEGSISSGGETFQFINFKRQAPAIYYSIIPIPSIATIVSLGFINKLYLLLMYFFIRRRLDHEDTKYYLLILLFLPTLLLYSSTGLRDTFILIIQSLLLFFIIERRFTLSTLSLILLASIKTQNAAVLLVLYAGIFLFRSDKGFSYLLAFLIAFIVVLFLFQQPILDVIHYFRIGFLNETGLLPLSGIVSEYKTMISIIIDSPILFLKGIFSPGLDLSILSLIFLPESILFILLFIIGSWYSDYFSKSTNWLVFIVFYVGIVLNSVVVENDATFLRYRFTFIYLLMFHLLLSIDKKKCGFKKQIS